jgi:hypothetical protein
MDAPPRRRAHDEYFHLSTLFPEVRPKEYFELRSADTIEEEWLPAPVVFVTSLVYDRESSQRAFEIVGTPNYDLLELAGIKGVAHPALRRMARALADIALDGAESLGEDYISRRDIRSRDLLIAGSLRMPTAGHNRLYAKRSSPGSLVRRSSASA